MEDLRVRILLALDKCTRKHLPHGQERSVEVSVKGITILKKLIVGGREGDTLVCN